MQDNLESGYLDFQTNMTANTNATVWIAPVGLAWKAIHDDIVAANGVPTAPGNMFYDLYTNDGSHPSLSGSYLSACVMYATLTGHSPVGLNDSTNLNSTLKLQLQQYASDTVFNNTSSLTIHGNRVINLEMGQGMVACPLPHQRMQPFPQHGKFAGLMMSSKIFPLPKPKRRLFE